MVTSNKLLIIAGFVITAPLAVVQGNMRDEVAASKQKVSLYYKKAHDFLTPVYLIPAGLAGAAVSEFKNKRVTVGIKHLGCAAIVAGLNIAYRNKDKIDKDDLSFIPKK